MMAHGMASRMASRMAQLRALVNPPSSIGAVYRPDSPRESGLYTAPRNTRGSQQLSAGMIQLAIRMASSWAILDPACLQQVLYRPKSPRDLGLYKAPMEH